MYMCRPHSAHFPQQLTVLLAQPPCWREHSSSQAATWAATTIRRMPPPLEPESSSVGSTDDESAPMKRPAAEDEPELPPAAAWKALVCLFLAMVAIGHCQYTWTLFVASFAEALSASTAAVQAGFSVFVICQTGSVLAVGLAVGRARLRSAMQVGSVLVALGLGGLSAAATLPQLYASCALLGVGVGAVCAWLRLSHLDGPHGVQP